MAERSLTAKFVRSRKSERRGLPLALRPTLDIAGQTASVERRGATRYRIPKVRRRRRKGCIRALGPGLAPQCLKGGNDARSDEVGIVF
jgi:hypothetical protein